MRVVIDTNILISALLLKESPAATLIDYWRQGKMTVLTTPLQLEEFTRVLRYPKIRQRVPASKANALIADLQELSVLVEQLPAVLRSRDPADNYLLALAEEGNADYLITGDKKDLLALKEHAATEIVSLRGFLEMIAA